MKTHKLKILHLYYVDLVREVKTFELRKNDRDYQVGDFIEFIVIDDEGCMFDTPCIFRINYILANVPQYGLDKDYCILGLKRL